MRGGFCWRYRSSRYQGLLSQVLDTFSQPSVYIGQEATGRLEFQATARWTEFKRETLEQADETVKRQHLQLNMERTWSPS